MSTKREGNDLWILMPRAQLVPTISVKRMYERRAQRDCRRDSCLFILIFYLTSTPYPLFIPRQVTTKYDMARI